MLESPAPRVYASSCAGAAGVIIGLVEELG
jgi:hypothetical protein